MNTAKRDECAYRTEAGDTVMPECGCSSESLPIGAGGAGILQQSLEHVAGIALPRIELVGGRAAGVSGDTVGAHGVGGGLPRLAAGRLATLGGGHLPFLTGTVLTGTALTGTALIRLTGATLAAAP